MMRAPENGVAARLVAEKFGRRAQARYCPTRDCESGRFMRRQPPNSSVPALTLTTLVSMMLPPEKGVGARAAYDSSGYSAVW